MIAVSTLRETWQLLLQFAFLYPLAMSYVWMLGALGFHWRHERREQAGSWLTDRTLRRLGRTEVSGLRRAEDP